MKISCSKLERCPETLFWFLSGDCVINEIRSLDRNSSNILVGSAVNSAGIHQVPPF